MILEIKVYVKLIYEILLSKKDMELLERAVKKIDDNSVGDIRLK